ncbi:MAG: sigma-70 family RNA polymerase sigma factor [Planctomycetes bacterium]|nr:sigma-70 family RNA polymerase sigma factor [Planctomycetota bacterium]
MTTPYARGRSPARDTGSDKASEALQLTACPNANELFEAWYAERDPQARKEAFERLYARYKPILLRWAQKVVDADTAEDVVQDVFDKQFVKHAGGLFDLQKSDPLDWLSGVVRNKARDYLRARKKRKNGKVIEVLTGEAGASAIQSHPGRNPDGASGVLTGEVVAKGTEFITELSRNHYLLVMLKLTMQLTNTQIARALCISNATITAWFRTVREPLHELLGVPYAENERTRKATTKERKKKGTQEVVRAERVERAVRTLAECVTGTGRAFDAVVAYLRRNSDLPDVEQPDLAIELIQDTVIASFNPDPPASLSYPEWEAGVIRATCEHAFARIQERGCAIVL